MFLFYRDSLDCIEYLLGNPLFADCMDFCPVHFYQDVEQTIQIYTEWLTADAAWEMQVSFYPQSKAADSHCGRSRFFQTVQLFLASSFHPTKPISLS